MKAYQEKSTYYLQIYKQKAKQYNLISFIRVGIALVFFLSLYAYAYQGGWRLAGAMWGLGLVFMGLIKWHSTVGEQMRFYKALVQLNTEELAYLKEGALPFEDGALYAPPSHEYAQDLDVFGKNGLYQHLNRTATCVGKDRLAKILLTRLPAEAIPIHQEAVQELSQKIDWRQSFTALGKVYPDTPEALQKLAVWSSLPTVPVSTFMQGLTYLMPVIFGGLCFVAWLTQAAAWGGMAFLVFLLNLLILLSQVGKIKREIAQSAQIDKYLKQYSLMFEMIEEASFESALLVDLQKKLSQEAGKASQQIQRLSGIFHQFDSLQNVIGAILFNGALLYHLHAWRAMVSWKKAWAHHIKTWLDVMAEVDCLNSLANFTYNHLDYHFPTINQAYRISFKQIGHPLLNTATSIKNDVAFEDYQFIILTGSNMSGKSTFLRTLGVNMLLASIGAPVCAQAAEVHPLPIWVSMRLSDSLQDSESYFFAEVKRLKQIMQAAQKDVCFVLLDEILRGTNSDDKRSGTVGVIKKLIAQRAFGAIATHDVEVCLITASYPKQLVNKCFEVQIQQGELAFDYKLRDGICQNKSATFLMQKMEII